MAIISAPIEIPESFGEELAAVIAVKVLQKVGESIKAEDLPPYPTKKQVKQILRIGEERINEWIIEDYHKYLLVRKPDLTVMI